MQNGNSSIAREIMRDFADLTGLTQARKKAVRYLWTDAFAVCNFLEIFHQTHDRFYLDLALRLVDQVHYVLGRHREDDLREGWISGLDEQEGKKCPTKGGLRIGKKLNERKLAEPFDDRLEWDRDGQYYHYLTKWIHALNCMTIVTQDPVFNRYAEDLANTAHSAFIYHLSDGTKRMYWKMSIDLTYSLVPSMGHHDPLDGFITYNEVRATAKKYGRHGESPVLKDQIADMADICDGKNWATNDPLGIGGLLFDAWRIAQLIVTGDVNLDKLLENLLEDALTGLKSFATVHPLNLPAEYRLAFREFGLSIGLKAISQLSTLIGENPYYFDPSLPLKLKPLMDYSGLIEQIENFWKNSANRESMTWKDHRDINMVMLATSLAPAGFLCLS